jgi:Sec-independent protein translocase protein TatA
MRQIDRERQWCEQNHRGDPIGTIAEERLPDLGRRASSLRRVFRTALREMQKARNQSFFEQNGSLINAMSREAEESHN